MFGVGPQNPTTKAPPPWALSPPPGAPVGDLPGRLPPLPTSWLASFSTSSQPASPTTRASSPSLTSNSNNATNDTYANRPKPWDFHSFAQRYNPLDCLQLTNLFIGRER